MKRGGAIYRVAVATPLRRLFDYLPLIDSNQQIQPGCRVTVPFGKRKQVTGIVIEITNNSDFPADKLKHINRIIDSSPVIDRNLLNMILWASNYYHHPIGEIVFNALPVWLRKDNDPARLVETAWQLTTAGEQLDPNNLRRAPKQASIINYLKVNGPVCAEARLLTEYPKSRSTLRLLQEKGLIEKTRLQQTAEVVDIKATRLQLNNYQKQAVQKVVKSIGQHQVFLLDGLTGSGKTEVYLSAIEEALNRKLQCLILLPEIGLTPQLIERFKKRFNCHIAIQHSGLSELERIRYWLDAKTGKAQIIMGTRSAVWTQLDRPGLYIIDEEHDLSYKQQDGFRYSAKDMLIMRAKRDKVPILLGSATPSLESLRNVEQQKYQHLILPSRAGNASLPEFKLLDMRGKKMFGAVSQLLVDEIRAHLDKGSQVLLFLNRRGYANNLLCHGCGWRACCERCEQPYTFHKSRNRLVCHHCESNRPKTERCPHCDAELVQLGHGTERIEEVLQPLFPDKAIVRIDRDTTRKKESFSAILEQIKTGKTDIMIGTQMLAKGHHFPNVTLTAIIDADRGLFANDFRASERLAQLFIQVSGRSGRGDKAGKVLVQTHNPEHPLFQQLINNGYGHFAQELLQERKAAALPPYSFMALLSAEAHNTNDGKLFLSQAAAELKTLASANITVFGPIPALIEKRGGRYRMQLVLQASNRKSLHEHLDNWLLQLESMKLSKKVRWALDVDPQDVA